jgi:hypothetical protein
MSRHTDGGPIGSPSCAKHDTRHGLLARANSITSERGLIAQIAQSVLQFWIRLRLQNPAAEIKGWKPNLSLNRPGLDGGLGFKAVVATRETVKEALSRPRSTPR